MSLRLVIDASVARAAGQPGTARNRRSTTCRDLLLAVLDVCHRVVLTGEIRDEWHRHRSRFARTWLTSMFARKKAILVEDDLEHQDLRAALERAALTDKGRGSATKDLLLVEAALAHDRIVISLDGKARREFEKVAAEWRPLGDLLWFVADTSPHDGERWLVEDCPPRAGLRLDDPGRSGPETSQPRKEAP